MNIEEIKAKVTDEPVAPKRFWVTGDCQYYPEVGLGSLEARCDTLEGAIAVAKGASKNCEYVRIYDVYNNNRILWSK